MIIPEDFTDQLQRELKSSPQPCLVPFLKKSLPHLRQSLAVGELTIEGVQPPSRVTVAPGLQQLPHIQVSILINALFLFIVVQILENLTVFAFYSNMSSCLGKDLEYDS